MPRLSIDIEARLASFQDSLDQVSRQTRELTTGINERFTTLSRTFGLLAGAVGGISFGAIIKGSIDAADNLGKLSQRVGVSVEKLSELQYAGKLADVSSEALADGLKKLSVNAQEAATKGGDTAKAFAAIGITQAELARLSPDQLLRRVADAYSQIEDGAGKTANAVAIGGRSFNELIPLLNAGAKGLDQAGDEARRFGLVVSADTARAAEQFNDNLTRMQQASRSLGITISNEVLPALNALLQRLVDSGSAAGSFGEGLFRSLIGQGRDVKSELIDVEKRIKAIREERDQLKGSFGDSAFARAIPGLSRVASLEEEEGRLRVTRDYLKRLQEIQAQRDVPAVEEQKRRVLQAALPGGDGKDIYAAGTQRAGKFLANIWLGQLQEIEKQGREIQQDLARQFQDGIDADLKAAADFKAQLDRLLADTPSGKTAAIQGDLGTLNDALIQGRINAAQYEEAFANIQERFDALRPKVDDVKAAVDPATQAFKDLENAIQGWGRAFNEELVQGLRKGQLDFRRIVDTIITDIARLMLYRAVTQPLFGAIGNFATSVFGGPGATQNPNYFQFGKKAAGGPITGGMPYLVGEQGPELIIPANSGTVIPNNALGGATVNVVINAPVDGAYIRNAVMQGVAMSQSQMGRAARIGALS